MIGVTAYELPTRDGANSDKVYLITCIALSLFQATTKLHQGRSHVSTAISKLCIQNYPII